LVYHAAAAYLISTEINMNKKIVAVVLIVLAGGAWIYLDYLNKQQKLAAEQTRKTMEQAKAEARARFDAMLRSDLSTCLSAAEKTRTDYIALNQKPVPRKPGEFTVSQAVSDKAAAKLADDKAACQLTYDTRTTHGW
jgi:hypothetical protein